MLRLILFHAGMGGFRQHKLKYYLSAHWHGIDLINSCWGAFFVFAGIGWIWLLDVDMHFVSWQVWKGCGQRMIRCIYYLNWHWVSFVNTRWDTFCVLACIYWISSIHVEMHFVSSMAWEGFGQQKLIYILCPRCHVSGFVNTCWDVFCVPMLGPWQHILSYIL